MVPFAEVVLLTAMEYNREDKKKVKKTKKKKGKKTKNLKTTSLVVAPVDENVPIDEIEKRRPCLLNCGIPSLKTVGEFVFNSKQIIFSLSREEGATSACGHQLLRLLWSGFDVLFSDLTVESPNKAIFQYEPVLMFLLLYA